MDQLQSNLSVGEDMVYAKISRRLLPILLVGYIAAYLDRVNVGFAKLQMLVDLQLSETAYGIGAGMFFIGYFLFEVPSNLALHRVGARRWIARIMISWGILSALMATVRSAEAFYILRFLLGIAEAGFFPGVIYYLTRFFPSRRRARVTSLFMTGVAVSSIFGSLVSGFAMETFDGVVGLRGWQWLFILEAIPSVLIGFYILRRLPDNLSDAAWLSAKERQVVSNALAEDQSMDEIASLSIALREPRVWLACTVYFALVAGLYGVGFWLPSIISDLGVTQPLQVGALASIPYSFAAISMVVVGRSADKHDEHRWHVALPAAAGALGLALSPMLGTSTFAAVLLLTLATSGILTACPLFWSLPTAYLKGRAAAGGIAVINSFGNLAGFLGPYLMGVTKDLTGSTTTGLYTIAAIVSAGAALVACGMVAPKKALN